MVQLRAHGLGNLVPDVELVVIARHFATSVVLHDPSVERHGHECVTQRTGTQTQEEKTKPIADDDEESSH